MNVIVLPVDPANTPVVGVVNVPDPSAEVVTLMDGDDARLVSVPPLVDFSWACQIWAPRDDVAVAPVPLPYTIVPVAPLDSVTPDTVIV